MCIYKHHDREFKCCCGCPLITGVIIIFVLCLLDLWYAAETLDIFGIVVYSILSIWFITSFIRKDCHKTRQSLYMSYGLGFIIFLIYLVWYCFISDEVESRAHNFCHSTVVGWTDWENCDDFMNDFLWVFVGVYLFFLIILRGFCVRILYYYAKEVDPKEKTGEEQRYLQLAGKNNGQPEAQPTAAYHQNNSSDNQMHGNTMH